MHSGIDDSPIVDINVTPLVDVALVLLIIFLATSYLIAQQSLKVELPKASRAVPTEARTVAIVVKASGEILVDGRQVSSDALLAELEARKRANANLQIVLGADTHTLHGRVVEAMDVARAAGIERVAIAVERR